MSPLAKLLSTLGRLYPLYSGYKKVANSKLFRWSVGNNTGVVWTRLRGGAWILVPINEWDGRTLYFCGDTDPKITWICKQILRPGDTVLDIGANNGHNSIYSRQLVGANGIVHAFEPQPFMVDLIYKSLEKNGYSNVVVHNIALGDKKESKDLWVPDSNSGEGTFCKVDSREGQTVPVLVENATEYLAQLNLHPIRLVKIDVEGFEADIIKGASEFFETNRPDAILFELNDYSIAFLEQPVVNMLSKLGYQFFDIPKSKFRMRLYPLDSSASKWYGNDILAVQKGDVYNDIAKLIGAV